MPEKLIEKYALANALKYNGQANAGNIIGQIIRENPEAKAHIKEIQAKAASIVAKVNALSLDEQRNQLEKIAPELLEKKEHKEHDKFAFLNIQEGAKVITGFPPEPSKYPHIGHAKALLVNYELAKRYNGKFHMRFDDTNPTLAQQEFYDIHLENYVWLGVKPDQLDIASDLLPKFYEFAEKLIHKGECFVCDCDAETTNGLRYKGQPCPHREQSVEETIEKWKNLKEGQVLRLRIKSDHKNTTMRDPTIFRVMKEPHVRTGTKYTVWPTYDFETCIMDSLQHITDRLRTKEFELRSELHNYIQTLCGFRPTNYYEFARFNMVGVESSGRLIRERVQSGDLIGWDDPSLTTLVALRRRGFTPEAIRNFVLSTGLTKNEATLTWDDLYVHNRRVLNETAKRLFFVENPHKIHITGAPEKNISLSFFPQHKLADRTFQTKNDFLISAEDHAALKEGSLYRLIDCFNFTKQTDGSFAYVGDDLEVYRASGERIMHFLPVEHEAVNVEILMPDKTVLTGLGESRIKTLKPGDIVQFERFGFCRLDAITSDAYKFWFTHK